LTLGSLFDGIAGFPLAAAMNGIVTLWASEIETAPISITKRHFPDMKHLGDIKDINGAEIEPVDIITFGSPCQDLSIAGKRAGLEGKRSGLFMEALRVIKEMREKTNGKYPRRIIWENVDGAFSSNEGEDFRIVLEEIANISAEKRISIPRPPAKDGNVIWESAGAIMGDSWSLAWRTMDAQYWGVPQRRKRIFLVADFTGQCAGEILFKPEGLSRNTAEGREAREGAAGKIENGVKASGFNGWRSITGSLEYKDDRAPCLQATNPPDVVVGVDGYNQNLTGDIVNTLRGGRVDTDNIGLIILNDQGGSSINVEKGDISPTLKGQAKGHEPLVFEPGAVSRTGGHYYEDGTTGTLRANMGDNQFAIALENHPNDSRIKIIEDGKVQTLSSRMGTGGGNVPLLMTKENKPEPAIALDCRNFATNEELSAPLQAKSTGGHSLNFINPIYCMAAKQQSQNIVEDKSPPVMANDYKEPNVVAYPIQGFGDYKEADVASTMKSRDAKDSTDLITVNYSVRRLTPLECERLQGLPDGWTEYGIVPEKYRVSLEKGKKRTGLPESALLQKISDSARYKALGNSMAKPCVDFIMSLISINIEE